MFDTLAIEYAEPCTRGIKFWAPGRDSTEKLAKLF
jgi:hypothetical protein